MELPERPKWLETALQGLAYWMGHRQSLYAKYPLTEGAMVAEACNLIFANLTPGLVLLPERLYKNLVSPSMKKFQGQSARVDLTICDDYVNQDNINANISGHVKYAIEIKRGLASNHLINADLKRLYELKNAVDDDLRCLLFVISEGKAPKRFVKDGKSKLSWEKIPGCSGYYKVRRTVKAASSFSSKEKAHYVCMLEVFRKRKILKKAIGRQNDSDRKASN